MARLIQLVLPLKVDKFTAVLRVRGVYVYVHWSVFAIVAFMLAGTLRRPIMTLVGITCYFTLLLIHECGHMLLAQRKGCHVQSITLYPIHGICCIDEPWSRFDHCLIAWGGILAQMAIALPLVAWISFFGYTRFAAINAILAILGGYSVVVAVFNLLPIGRLDGRLAWGLIPEWIKRVRKRRNRQVSNKRTDWRTY